MSIHTRITRHTHRYADLEDKVQEMADSAGRDANIELYEAVAAAADGDAFEGLCVAQSH